MTPDSLDAPFSPHDALQDWLREDVAPDLRHNGYRGSKVRFTKSANDYRAQISFQKSRYNSKESVEFTINLAVTADVAIAEHEAAYDWAREKYGRAIKVMLISGNWRCNIGQVFSGRSSQRGWWTFDSKEALVRVSAEVKTGLEVVQPIIDRELQRPLLNPPYVIETKGWLTGSTIDKLGNRRYHNLGGKRLYPLDRFEVLVAHEPVPYLADTVKNYRRSRQTVLPMDLGDSS